MRERPILFSAPMVRAILEGRKTQTRRVVKHPRGGKFDVENGRPVAECTDGETRLIDCPYGQPGDRLWVRETWGEDDTRGWTGPVYCYRADGEHRSNRWRPSIHMPRKASRITLEVTGVRVERLQAISEGDAIAEGCRWVGTQDGRDYYSARSPDPGVKVDVFNPSGAPSGRAAFEALWGSINGAESWNVNPWVWVVEFRRITPPEAPGHGE